MILAQISMLAPLIMPGPAMRVGVVGDSQQQPAIFATHCQTVAAEGISLFVGLGDHVQNHGQPGEWLTLWQQPRAPISSIPVIGCIGNHDDIIGYSANVWQIPQHPVASIYGPAIACYGAVTVGQVRWVFLDTNEDPSIRLSLQPGGSQRVWLQARLADGDWKSARYRIVCWHHPADTEQWEGLCYYPRLVERTWLMDSCRAAGASLVLNGHSHSYQRGAWNGMSWIISGGGGGYLDTTHCQDLPEITVAQAVYHCLVIDVNQNSLHVRALTTTRSLIDEVWIQ